MSKQDTQETWKERLKSGKECFFPNGKGAVHIHCLTAFIQKELDAVMASKPKGVTAWKEEGKKLGYWDYFEKQIKHEKRKDLEEKAWKYDQLNK